MQGTPYTLDEIKSRLAPAAKRYGVAKAYLFGSYARGEARPESDIDICIEEGRPLSLFDLSGLYLDLEEALAHKIDVVAAADITGSFKENIEKERVLVYG
ncbi:MAG: putative nucleotidyltransferases [Treponematales bacterium]